MKNIAQIHYTKNYDLFKLFKENRDVLKLHVERFIVDKTFPEKFCTCPIVVDSDLNIIDGQHRFEAAKKLDIGIYYIIDTNGTSEDIKIRNSRSVAWKGEDFINFYADKGVKNYVTVRDVRNKHAVPLTWLNSILKKITGTAFYKYNDKLKNGELDLKNSEIIFMELTDALFPKLKECRNIKGGLISRPLFSDMYLAAFTHFFLNDRRVFDRAMEKICICSYEFTYVSTFEMARHAVKKISDWRRPSIV